MVTRSGKVHEQGHDRAGEDRYNKPRFAGEARKNPQGGEHPSEQTGNGQHQSVNGPIDAALGRLGCVLALWFHSQPNDIIMTNTFHGGVHRDKVRDKVGDEVEIKSALGGVHRLVRQVVRGSRSYENRRGDVWQGLVAGGRRGQEGMGGAFRQKDLDRKIEETGILTEGNEGHEG